MSKCEECGEAVSIGDWPFCHGDPAKHVHVNRFGESPLEPYIDWNITKDIQGIEFHTRGERRKYMAQHQLEYKSKVSKPGDRLYFDLTGSR